MQRFSLRFFFPFLSLLFFVGVGVFVMGVSSANAAEGDLCEGTDGVTLGECRETCIPPEIGIGDTGGVCNSGFAATCCGEPDREPVVDICTSSGIVPCGRTCNDPKTDEDETAICTICHIFLGIDRIVDFLMKLLTFVAITALVIAGIIYMVSAGNESLTTTAKNAMKSILFGFGVVLLGWVIVNTVILYLGARNDIAVSWSKVQCNRQSTAFKPGEGPQPPEPEPEKKYACDTGTKQCSEDASGAYTSLVSCEEACNPQEPPIQLGGLKISPGALDFGEVRQGEKGVLTITLESTYIPIFSVDIELISFPGPDRHIDGDFEKQDACEGDLGGGQKCAFSVTFEPTHCSGKETFIDIKTNEGHGKIPVKGAGIGCVYHGSIVPDKPSYSVKETDDSFIITLNRVDGKTPVELEYIAEEIADSGYEIAQSGVDFEAISPTILSWAQDEIDSKTITVTPIAGSEYKPARMFKLALTRKSGEAIFPGFIPIIIEEDDNASGGTIFFDSDTFATVEGNDPGGHPLPIRVQRENANTGILKVQLKTTDGSAKVPTEYIAAPPYTQILEWGDGENGIKTSDILIFSDTIPEQREKTFTIDLEIIEGVAEFGTPKTATGLIVDDD